ncbi:hypothetical protein ElyMa_003500300 [Elysia marginata]|uniref:Uncharacterized protein n=1 Tax=Elysia marginata TaxID=1093978 RepID=A0AAV4EDV4_9GAST|nr:hypothetical protein ElyMa_003500300 [Elysia marginata]
MPHPSRVQTSTFEACSWVPLLQVGGLRKIRVSCFPKAIATWHGRESSPRPPDPESDAAPMLKTALGTIESVQLHYDVRSACIHHTQSHNPDIGPTRLNTKSTMPDTKEISC